MSKGDNGKIWSVDLVTNPHSNLDMACAVESVVSKLSQTLGMEISWKIRLEMLEKSVFQA
jgi:hypothetical protein